MKLAKRIFNYIWDTYWNLRGIRKLEVGNVAAKFKISSHSVARSVRVVLGQEKDTLEMILSDLEPSDVFFDVGAHLGFYSCFVDKILTNGKVFAFEPHPPNVHHLKQNLTVNGSDVKLLEIALSDSTGDMQPFAGKDNIVDGTASIATGSEEDSFRVSTETGDKLISEGICWQPNVVKIDVEGAEYLCLKGMEKALADEECRLLYCELHPSKIKSYGKTTADVKDLISDTGFENVQIVKEREKVIHLRCSKD